MDINASKTEGDRVYIRVIHSRIVTLSFCIRAAALKLLFKLLFLVVFLSPFALVTLFIVSLQDQPLVEHQLVLTQKDIEKARKLLKQHNPRWLKVNTERTLQLDKTALDLAGRYFFHSIQPAFLSSGFQSELFNHGLKLKLSIGPSMLPVNYYFNLQLELSKSADRLQLANMRLGAIDIPDEISALLIEISPRLLSATEEWGLLQQSLVDYRFSEKALEVDYRWLSQTEQLARKRINSYLENPSLQYYALELAKLDRASQYSFSKVVTHLFKLADSRSDNRNPIEENRAVLLLLGKWALGKRSFNEVRLPYFNLKLNRRKDLAQHLLVSAAISSHSNTLLSNLIGTGKEVNDADGGSGFSFDDLTADRLGTLLGKTAVINKSSASEIQKRLSDIQTVRQIFPVIKSRHAPLNEQQFIRLYGSVDDPRYKAMLEEIDLAISNSPVFRGL